MNYRKMTVEYLVDEEQYEKLCRILETIQTEFTEAKDWTAERVFQMYMANGSSYKIDAILDEAIND